MFFAKRFYHHRIKASSRCVREVSSFYGSKIEGSEKVSHLLNVPQLCRGGAGL